MALPVIATAATTQLVSILKSMFGQAGEMAGNVLLDENYHATSLTKRAKQCFIESRAYIDHDIAHEAVTSGIIKFALALSGSLVVTSVGLDAAVSAGVTVSDRLRAVSTEHMLPYVDTVNELQKDSIALESVSPNPKFSSDIHHLDTRIEALERQPSTDQRDKELTRLQKERARLSQIETADITPSTDLNLAMGKVVEITFNGPNNLTVKVPLYIKINPYLVAPELMSYLLETTAPALTSSKRWAQLQAGEITFWRDYVFGMDIAEKLNRTLAKDKTGEFAQYISMSANKDRSRLIDTALKAKKGHAYTTSSNLANAVLIFSEAAVREGEMRGHLRLSNPAQRQRFFDKNYAAMIFVVDPSHERVTMYLNGFAQEAHLSYSDFVRKKDIEGVDFLSVLRTVASGNISRF